MTPASALHDLLLKLFEPDELRRWIRYGNERSVIADELPEVLASRNRLATAVIHELQKHQLINTRFFDDLRDCRKQRAAEIVRVESLWKRYPQTTTEHRFELPGLTPKLRALANSDDVWVGEFFGELILHEVAKRKTRRFAAKHRVVDQLHELELSKLPQIYLKTLAKRKLILERCKLLLPPLNAIFMPSVEDPSLSHLLMLGQKYGKIYAHLVQGFPQLKYLYHHV